MSSDRPNLQDFTVDYDRRKLIGFAALCVAVIFISWKIVEVSRHRPNADMPALVVMTLAMSLVAFLALYRIFKLLRSNEQALIVSNRGIYEHASIAFSAGWMAWEEIGEVRLKRGLMEGGVPTLYISLRDEATFFQSRGIGVRLIAWLRKCTPGGAPIMIMPALLTTDTEAIYEAIVARRPPG